MHSLVRFFSSSWRRKLFFKADSSCGDNDFIQLAKFPRFAHGSICDENHDQNLASALGCNFFRSKCVGHPCPTDFVTDYRPAEWRVPAFGLDVLAAPEDPTMRTAVSRQFAGELCAFWRERYAAVVLDLPDVRAAVDCGFAAQADIVLLVTTNELAALQATGRGLRCLDAGGGDRAKLRLILNRYTPATGLKREDVKTALALEPFAI